MSGQLQNTVPFFADEAFRTQSLETGLWAAVGAPLNCASTLQASIDGLDSMVSGLSPTPFGNPYQTPPSPGQLL